MYCDTNFQSKKALREAIKNGRQVTVFQPGPFGGKSNGDVTVEGPHYPEPHRWYARVRIENGVITKVLG